MKKSIKLLMYTNSAPLGDARAYSVPGYDETLGVMGTLPGETPATPDTPATPAADSVTPDDSEPATPQSGDTPMEVTTPTPPPRRIPFFLRNRKPKIVNDEDLGKIQTFVTDIPSKEEITQIPGENCHCIVSPRWVINIVTL